MNNAIAKGFNGLGAVLFLVFTTLQFNDATQYGNHDAWVWIMVYGAMAVISGLAIFKTLPHQWLFAWAGFCWGALVFRLQDNQGNVHFEWLHPSNYWDATGTTMIQQSNESGGLLILAVWATLCVVINSREKIGSQ